jgi:ABC-type polysaccharide/polyol phosphate export permease
MFQPQTRRSTLRAALSMAELVFHVAVRNVRKSHGSPIIGLLMNIFQSVLMVVIFWAMFELLGMRGSALRGDFLLYIMSGVFLFMTHVKALGAVSGAEGPTSAMMKHSPMNTIVAIGGAALSALYLQVLSACVILYLYHTLFAPITIDQPVGTIAMFLLAWASGVGIGMMVMAAKPWWPEGVTMVSTIYMRVNMIFSGKMFVANKLPGYMHPYFEWNPLFHTIDQARGFIFLNYSPHYTSITYPIWLAAAFAMIGLMAESYTRKHASASWMAGK